MRDYHPDDTIVALASPPGGAARGIIRLSGPDTRACLERCLLGDRTALSRAARPVLLHLRLNLPAFSRSVPCELLWWPTSRSYTRQPSAELHLVGSPPVLEAAVMAFSSAGARIAKPGEFTLRAFLAGRIDLTQAEAVLGVIHARGEREFQESLEQLAGGLSRPLAQLRDRLLNLVADVEAGLDFTDEDIEFIATEDLVRELFAALANVQQLLANLSTRDTWTGQPRVALVGFPNVGKSSLFNALADARAAIVSPTAGSTRDYLVETIDCDGLTCELIDTAGIGVTSPSDLEAQAMSRGTRQHAQADLRLLCLDATRPPNYWEQGQLVSLAAKATILVWTKGDLGAPPTWWAKPGQRQVVTSSRTRRGLDELKYTIRAALSDRDVDGPSRLGASARCGESLEAVRDCFERAVQLARDTGGAELVAAELHFALDELGRIVGAIYTDDILDRLFSRFCIGK